MDTKGLAALPAEWVARLYEASIQADAEEVSELVDQISEQHKAFAEALRDLANDFRFDLLVELTRERVVPATDAADRQTLDADEGTGPVC